MKRKGSIRTETKRQCQRRRRREDETERKTAVKKRRLRRRDTLGQTQRLREAKADRDGHSEAGKESLRGKR